jgi:SRSO17 transposase
MTEVVPETEYQSLQHFMTHSPWEHLPVMDQVAVDADRLFGSSPDTAIIIDECSLPKKGKKSVGVSRQWSGRLGKIDNCQTGVYASLVNAAQVAIIACRLYLPEVWTGDRKRCKAAGVPDDIKFKTKSQLALDIIRHARSTGIRYAWVGVDGGYGKEPLFLQALEDDGEQFVADVHKDQPIYLEDPKPYIPERQSPKGRAPSAYKTDVPKMIVEKWAADQPEDAWQRVTTRDSTKGLLSVDILTRQVWVWLDAKQYVCKWHLVVRRETDSHKTIKYSLSNAPAETSPERLAYMQGQRFFVERSFQDAKETVGMDQYQVRGWLAWHHHMAMVMMASLFLLETRAEQKEELPLLSCPDIAALLAIFLPRRNITCEEVLRQMNVRHRQRQASIDSAYNRQSGG